MKISFTLEAVNNGYIINSRKDKGKWIERSPLAMSRRIIELFDKKEKEMNAI